MRIFAISLGCALLTLAGCASEEDQMENAIRENLDLAAAPCKEVELTKTDDEQYERLRRSVQTDDRRGPAELHRPAHLRGSNFNWRCVPAVDEAMLTQMENTIRQSLSEQATVLAVDMTRQDDDHMTGYAQVRDADGDEGRVELHRGARDRRQRQFQLGMRAGGSRSGAGRGRRGMRT